MSSDNQPTSKTSGSAGTGKTGPKSPPTYMVVSPGNFNLVFMTRELSAALAEAKLGFSWTFSGGVNTPNLSFHDEEMNRISVGNAMSILNGILSRTSRAGIVYPTKEAFEAAGGKDPKKKEKKVDNPPPSTAIDKKEKRKDGFGTRFWIEINQVLEFTKTRNPDLVDKLPHFDEKTFANDWHLSLNEKGLKAAWADEIKAFRASKVVTQPVKGDVPAVHTAGDTTPSSDHATTPATAVPEEYPILEQRNPKPPRGTTSVEWKGTK